MNSGTGKIFILAGLLIFFIGILIYFFHDKLNWVGNLPGDLRIERPGFRLYIPFTTMILFSILISLIIRIWSWLNL
ncbi:DUF2905 domain-containing protein [Daejeonella rubra]|uniref:DUF2905 domain-containing protein n=1 Tax=Daejeonella rubra TaxID=990371 RepID=UPI000B88B34B|nr:DUF2905 domain-containing protein [Daejeonella rubra]